MLILTAPYFSFFKSNACVWWFSKSECFPQSFNPHLSVFFFFFNAVLTVFVSLSSILSLSLCRNPMCRTVTAKWLASSRTHWAGTVAPPCSSVALPPATMMQKPNPPWCLANGKLLPCSGATGCCTVQHNTHPCLTQLQLFSWNVLNLGCAHILLSLTRLLMTCNLLWRQVLVSDGAEIA